MTTFDEKFAEERRKGNNVFKFQGYSYTTQYAREPEADWREVLKRNRNFNNPPPKKRPFQERITNWAVDTFGHTTALDLKERRVRFLEESLELVQASGGSKKEVKSMMDYVFSREIGEPYQEVGGVAVCLALLAETHALKMEDCAEKELARVNNPTMQEKVRAKHLTKPLRIKTPEDYVYPVGYEPPSVKPSFLARVLKRLVAPLGR